jgi:hypothetical protein
MNENAANRKFSDGATRTITYTPNVLNQYTSRDVSNVVDFAGYTDSTSDTVTPTSRP